MKEFTATPKRWGNSLGIVIPKEIVEEAKLSPKKRIKVMIVDRPHPEWEKIFGSIPDFGHGRSTQEILDEMDAEEEKAYERKFGHLFRR